MSSTAGCVSGGFCTEGSGIDGSGTYGSTFGNGSGLGSGGGYGEWLGVIGVVGILIDNNGLFTSSGESSRSSKNKLSITLLITSMSARLSSSIPLTSSLASGGWGLSEGIN